MEGGRFAVETGEEVGSEAGKENKRETGPHPRPVPATYRRGIVPKRPSDACRVRIDRHSHLYHVRRQLHSAAVERRTAHHRVRFRHFRDDRPMADVDFPARHGRYGAAHRLPDPPILHPPDRDRVDGGVHARLGVRLARLIVRTGFDRPSAGSRRHRRDVAGPANHGILHLSSVPPRYGDGHRRHGHERRARDWPHLGWCANRFERLAIDFPHADGHRRYFAASCDFRLA